jgi:ubiquinone/menaquinone biosynthesis C-methylase UbiE
MTFDVSGDAYDRFMGRYSRELAPVFADFGGVEAGQTALDVGCGSGVLTEELARRLGGGRVGAVDPSALVEACAERVPEADVRRAAVESLPWPDDSFDAALAQLVIHFLEEPEIGVAEMQRVTRPGGIVAASTWDFPEMMLLRLFWQSARAVIPAAEAESLPYGTAEQLEQLWADVGFEAVEADSLEVSSRYESFDELWASFGHRVGPAGQYLASLDEDEQELIRREYLQRLGNPEEGFTLGARAWAVRGRVPE